MAGPAIRIGFERTCSIRRWIVRQLIAANGRMDFTSSVIRAAASVTGDMKLAQLQLGHSRMSTTSGIYVHTNEQDIQRAGEALAETIAKVLPTKLPTNRHVLAHQPN